MTVRAGMITDVDCARAIVGEWLTSINHRPIPDRVEQLVPYAREVRPKSHEYRAIRRILAHHELPTPNAVAAEVKKACGFARARHQRAQAKRKAQMEQGITCAGEDLGPRVAAWVAQFRAEHSTGPTWGETARAANVPDLRSRFDVELLINHLAASGWLTPGAAPRSLTPGQAYH